MLKIGLIGISNKFYIYPIHYMFKKNLIHNYFHLSRLNINKELIILKDLQELKTYPKNNSSHM